MKKRVLFLVPYPIEGASARLRVYQFLPHLKEAGFECVVRPFLTPYFYRILYKKGRGLQKAALFVWCTARRKLDILRALFYDVIFIHREAYPIAPPVFEALLFLFRKKIVFDYDDAIYLPPQGSSCVARALKFPGKTRFIIRHGAAVIAGNEFLKAYAESFNRRIAVIPTCIDTDVYRRASRPAPRGGRIVIGWIGSHTTQVFLEELKDVFSALLSKYRDLEIHLVGGRLSSFSHARLMEKEWSLENEKRDMERFDIGIMPMPDTDWTRGKCAFKAILYMSLEIPVVTSPVGVNKRIIKDGVNGFLASSQEEWEEKLSRLIEDASLRRSLGAAGRATAEKEFSLRTNAPLLCEVLKKV